MDGPRRVIRGSPQEQTKSFSDDMGDYISKEAGSYEDNYLAIKSQVLGDMQ
jgi:hypothetical protein